MQNQELIPQKLDFFVFFHETTHTFVIALIFHPANPCYYILATMHYVPVHLSAGS